MKKFDYLIVGQGLAGSILAWKLNKKIKAYVLLIVHPLPLHPELR